VVQNVCDSPQSISLAALGNGQRSVRGNRTLGAKGTIQLKLEEFLDFGSEEPESRTGTIEVVNDNGSPCLFGHTLLLDTSRGFSISSELLHPGKRTSPQLNMVGGPAGHPGAAWGFPSSASFTTFTLLANLSEAPVVASPTVYGYDEGGGFLAIQLPDVTIPAYETQILAMDEAATSRGLPADGFRTMSVAHTGRPEDLSGIGFTVDDGYSLTFPCPLEDGDLGAVIKPVVTVDLREGRTTLLFVRNVSTQPTRFSFKVTYLGNGSVQEYFGQYQELGPSEFSVVNIKTIRDEAVPGQRGEILPAGLQQASALVAGEDIGALLVADPTIDKELRTVKLCNDICYGPPGPGLPPGPEGQVVCSAFPGLNPSGVTVVPGPIFYALVNNVPISGSSFSCSYRGCGSGRCRHRGPTVTRPACFPGLVARLGALEVSWNLVFVTIRICFPQGVEDLPDRPC
jgi:hypothetical protein